MYQAELRGKLSSRIERMEDVLTSNVFSFFKYTSREIFLRVYLEELGFDVSRRDAKEAEFIFWPHYETGTEPDLVVIVGDFYLLFEAKYFSAFSEGNATTKAQLLREIEEGMLDARNYGKDFNLIAITADYYYKYEKFKVIPKRYFSSFKWTNWQKICRCISDIIENENSIPTNDYYFASDLIDLLDKKKLRNYHGFSNAYYCSLHIDHHQSLFFDAGTAKSIDHERRAGEIIVMLDEVSSGTMLILATKEGRKHIEG